MAIEAYTGKPGEGKTYEVVKSVVLPAIKRGQRVVTNIRGLNPEVIARETGLPEGRVRALIKEFHTDDAFAPAGGLAPNFFPTEGGNDDGILEWGAYNIIDEAHFIFGTGSKFDNRGKYFLRQHRHENVDEQSTQIVIITQSIDDLTSSVRNVVRSTTRVIKKSMFGKSKEYWCRNFMGATEAPSKMINESSYKYVEPYISMYQTQRGKVANESGVDNRGVIWKNKKLQFFALLALLASGFLVYSFATMGTRIQKSVQPIAGVSPAHAAAFDPTGKRQCHTPIVLTEIDEFGRKVHYGLDAQGSLVGLPPVSVQGSESTYYSTQCL